MKRFDKLLPISNIEEQYVLIDENKRSYQTDHFDTVERCKWNFSIGPASRKILSSNINFAQFQLRVH